MIMIMIKKWGGKKRKIKRKEKKKKGEKKSESNGAK